MCDKLLQLKFTWERRYDNSRQWGEWAGGYRTAVKRFLEDIDRMLDGQVVKDMRIKEETHVHDQGGSRADRPLLGFDTEPVGFDETVSMG